MLRPSPSLTATIAALFAMATFACVHREREAVVEARARYEACVEAHGVSAPECQALAEDLRQKQERYEDAARMRWGCDPGAKECPEKR